MVEGFLDSIKDKAIKTCLCARERAKLLPNHHTKVGACVYTDKNYYPGFNIQNRCHKSYHAEEMAILDCMLRNVHPEKILGIIVSYSDNDLNNLTFCCGHCRQMLWEYTVNPELLVSEVSLDGTIIKELTLKELYPIPYPYKKNEII